MSTQQATRIAPYETANNKTKLLHMQCRNCMPHLIAACGHRATAYTHMGADRDYCVVCMDLMEQHQCGDDDDH